MKNTESLLLSLLRIELFSGETQFPDDVDWNTVLKEAQAQSVLGIAIKSIPDTTPKEVQVLWKGKDLQRIACFIRYLFSQDQLNELLVNAGIPYAILKGCAAAVQYPRPLARTMGDIDFIVPSDRFCETRTLLEENGYVYVHGEEGERHIVYRKDGFSFELHHHFSHDLPVLDVCINEGLMNTVTAYVEGHAFSMLPPLSNGIVLLDHMRSHLRTGMGLRQMIDWMMYADRYLDDAFWNDGFGDAARTCGLETLAMVATRIGQTYLGLDETISWCRSADDGLCGRLMESLFSTGNFGHKNGSGIKVEQVLMRFQQEGLFQTLQHTGECKWEMLVKHPRLKRFAWLYQLFRYVRQGLSVHRGIKIKDDIKRSADRLGLIRDLKLD